MSATLMPDTVFMCRSSISGSLSKELQTHTLYNPKQQGKQRARGQGERGPCCRSKAHRAGTVREAVCHCDSKHSLVFQMCLHHQIFLSRP